MSVNLRKPLDMQPANKPNAMKFLETIQGNILKAHARDHAMHLMICFGEPQNEAEYEASLDGAKVWIGLMAKSTVTNAAVQYEDTGKNKLFVSLLLSSSGYEYLGESRPRDGAFRDGMRERASQLNDPRFQQWEPQYKIDRDKLHALIIVASTDPGELDDAKIAIINGLNEFGGTILIDERGRQLRDGTPENRVIEHFGYADGVSQPQFFSKGTQEAAKYEQLTALKLVLEEDRHSPGTFGSYLVYRKLKQDVNSFNAAVTNVANQLGLCPDLAGAMAVGRFKNGTPLTSYGSEQPSYNPREDEDFDYDDDDSGSKCPFHGHIRKANPRGSLGLITNILAREQKRRIARRGISFQESDEKVGLLFMCYQSDVADQFEFIQRRWANSPSFSRSGTGLDPVIGQGDGDQSENESPRWPNGYDSKARTRIRFDEHVRLLGGEYFFAPSIPGLKKLAE